VNALGAQGLRRITQSPFVRQIGGTYLTQISVIALSFVNSILVTRLLGPNGRGLFAVAITTAALGVQLANLGLHSSNTYNVARQPALLPTLLGNSLLVGALSGVASFVGLVLFAQHPALAPLHGWLLVLSMAAVPIGLTNLLLQNLLIGTQRIQTVNVIDLTTRVGAVFLVAATAPLGLVTPEAVFGLIQLSVLASLGWCFRSLHSALPGPLATSRRTLEGGLAFGVRAYLGSLFSFMVLKSDILMVSYLRGTVETGYYAIAVGLADILLILPTVVGTVLFPRLSAELDAGERWRQARDVLRIMLPAVPLALVGVWLVSGTLIRLAYGPAFDPANAAVAWLLPGLGCMALNIQLMNLFAASGQPMVAVYSPLLALVVNVLLNLILIPKLGFTGAAISSSVAYALMLATSLLYVRFRLLEGKTSAAQGLGRR
jgi:O-antigen/teichoic acid export membrane protein